MAKKDPQMLTYDDLAELFGLPSFEAVNEGAWEYVADAGQYAYEEEERSAEEEGGGVTSVRGHGPSAPGPLHRAEEAREEAEWAAQDEVSSSWRDAVEAVADHEFGEVGLELQDRWHETGGKERFWVVPVESWRYSATQIMEIINGVGHFHFDNLKDFLDSGPYTPKEAVLGHLQWLQRRAEVYGDVRPNVQYERAVR